MEVVVLEDMAVVVVVVVMELVVVVVMEAQLVMVEGLMVCVSPTTPPGLLRGRERTNFSVSNIPDLTTRTVNGGSVLAECQEKQHYMHHNKTHLSTGTYLLLDRDWI